MKPQFDQYNEPVPDDLVVLDLDPSELTSAECEAIDDLDWYEPSDIKWTHLLLVSREALGKCFEGPIDFCFLEDIGFSEQPPVFKIANCFHRWDDIMFYSA